VDYNDLYKPDGRLENYNTATIKLMKINIAQHKSAMFNYKIEKSKWMYLLPVCRDKVRTDNYRIIRNVNVGVGGGMYTWCSGGQHRALMGRWTTGLCRSSLVFNNIDFDFDPIHFVTSELVLHCGECVEGGRLKS